MQNMNTKPSLFLLVASLIISFGFKDLPEKKQEGYFTLSVGNQSVRFHLKGIK